MSAPLRSGQASSTMQPRSSKVLRCPCSTDRTRRSSGRPPRSGHQATRTPLKLALERAAQRPQGRTGSSRDRGDRTRPSRSAGTRRRRPSGPCGPFTENPRNGIAVGAVGTSPTVGRRATMLLKFAGFRSEPPRSLPSAIGSKPVGQRRARAAARAARALRQVVRIERRPVHLVVGVRAHPELRHVRLADRDHARRAQSLDQDRVFLRREDRARDALLRRDGYEVLRVHRRRGRARARQSADHPAHTPRIPSPSSPLQFADRALASPAMDADALLAWYDARPAPAAVARDARSVRAARVAR